MYSNTKLCYGMQNVFSKPKRVLLVPLASPNNLYRQSPYDLLVNMPEYAQILPYFSKLIFLLLLIFKKYKVWKIKFLKGFLNYFFYFSKKILIKLIENFWNLLNILGARRRFKFRAIDLRKNLQILALSHTRNESLTQERVKLVHERI